MTEHGVGEVRELHRRALSATGEVVAGVRPADLGRPTPCARWSLEDLLVHLVNENRGYAAGALGAPAIVSIWYSADLEPGPYSAYQESADRVRRAFATPGVHEGSIEVREFDHLPAPVAIGMHFVDVLVHGWDVAVSIGEPYRPDPRSAATALAIASGWPPDHRRRAEFGPAVAVPDTASDFARLLGLLGRDPAWRPPRS
ncbi:TIGR03086 family metal-binding protein [Actinophytocola xanthii]|uniref:TIGR03086 family protein n=1 Tax=Actinophytocola xanthii TaxID=1912961 RepID=A0A1Q8CS36_9PSEU|nr:TIGR03086 family metal-binding protein [Actinophytocola xanthii]OLF17147.1 TIGR03086 family protein [Actinophytocola xanthii]